MNIQDLFALAPLLILFAAALVLLLVENKKSVSIITIGSLALAIAFAAVAPASTNSHITPWLTFDGLSRFFTLLFLATSLATELIAESYFDKKAEFSFFLLASCFGLILIAMAQDFLTLFIGLETLSISLYVLCSYIKTSPFSAEASFKYFLLGSVSTAILLFGIALIYGGAKTTALLMPADPNALFGAGIALVTISLLFKAAIFPFHIWTPDVYQGAPTPVTLFMAAATKAASFAAFIRIFLLGYSAIDPIWHTLISYMAIPTLLFANFVAMKQKELRRFFAYSGISHAGFLLIGLAAGDIGSILFYLVVYVLATVGCFASLSFVDRKVDGVTIDDLKGLFRASPVIGIAFTFCLVTLAGIPPSIGFFAKFYLLKGAFMQGYIAAVVTGLLTTILAAYYYLKIAAAIFSEQKEADEVQRNGSLIATSLAFAALVVLTFYPEPLLTILGPGLRNSA